MSTNPARHISKQAWFALTDGEQCRLLGCSMTLMGKYHIEEYGSLLNTLPDPEHHRPMTNAGETHHVENKERLFAGEIVDWLQAKAREHRINRLVLFAPPDLLGTLRSVPLGSLLGHMDELKGNLMRLNAGELADHPMIRELLPAHGGDGTEPLKPAASIKSPG